MTKTMSTYPQSLHIANLPVPGQPDPSSKSIMLGGRLGGSVGQVSDLGSGHDLTVHGFKAHIGLCTDRFSAPPPLTLSLSQNK